MIKPDHENTIISTYTKKLKVGKEKLQAELRSYEYPIRKTTDAECYTRLEIFKDGKPWGNMNYSHPIANQHEADNIFSTISKSPDQFKTAPIK